MDKQIIIDGVDVSGCSYGEIEKSIFKCSCEYNVRSASMFCKDNPNCYYKQLKRKEQECEELKKIINEAQNSKLDLKSFLVGEAVQNEYEQQLDQLKAENEELKQTLIEIQQDLEFATYCESQECGCDDANECLECTKNQILQKISEVEYDR